MSSAARTRRRRLLRKSAACPDCSSEVRVLGDASDARRLEVRHDPTCPQWQAHGARAYREIRIGGIG